MYGQVNFNEWPQESIEKFAALLEQVVTKVVRNELSRAEVNTDAAYLASLTKEEYDKHMRGQK